MALLHKTSLNPTKLELLTAWLPAQPWYAGREVTDLQRVASYRFDDPDGEVGVETMLIQAADGPLLQTPLTYRAAPLPGAEAWLVGTTHHGTLGPRWVYDGGADPVYAACLAHAILTGGVNAEEFLDDEGTVVRREPTSWVRGSGSGATLGVTIVLDVDAGDPLVIRTDSVELTVARILDDATPARLGATELTLTGTWTTQHTPLLLATARPL